MGCGANSVKVCGPCVNVDGRLRGLAHIPKRDSDTQSTHDSELSSVVSGQPHPHDATLEPKDSFSAFPRYPSESGKHS
jgi:hypothetical protein